MVACLVSPHTRDDTTKRWDRKLPFLLQSWALDQIPAQKFITVNIYHLRPERRRLVFDELVLGKDRLVCGCHFYGTVRRRDGARVRSFAES